MDYLAQCQAAAAGSTTPDSNSLSALPSCEFGVKNVCFEENALSNAFKQRLAEARIFAAQVKARKSMGSQWLLWAAL